LECPLGVRQLGIPIAVLGVKLGMDTAQPSCLPDWGRKQTDSNEQFSHCPSIWRRIFLVSYWLVLSHDKASHPSTFQSVALRHVTKRCTLRGPIQRWSESLFLTPAPKKVTPAPAPKLIGNLHSDSRLNSESLKTESILPHEVK